LLILFLNVNNIYIIQIEEYNVQFPEEAEEYRLSKVKGPKGVSKSKSYKHGSTKSRKSRTKDDSEGEEVAKDYESEEIDNDVQSDSEHEKEREEDIRTRNLETSENETEGIEESNLDERTPKRSLIPTVVSALHSKKRSHSLSSEPRRVPPSKRYQTVSLMSTKRNKSSRESSHSMKNKNVASSSITTQVV
jgi:hypothetical protein